MADRDRDHGKDESKSHPLAALELSDAISSGLNVSRFPQPYAHRKSDLFAPTARLPASLTGSEVPTPRIQSRDGSPDNSDPKRALDRRKWFSPSESGTEADDESPGYIKALPAPPGRARKGLRGSKEEEGDLPTLLDKEVIRLSDLGIPEPGPKEPSSPEVEASQAARSEGVKRRRAEILRRTLEGALLVISGALVLANQRIWRMLTRAEKACSMSHAIILACVYAAYPLRLIAYSWQRTTPRRKVWNCIRLSAGFDPAPYIYPTILPCIVALSLFPSMPTALIPNLVLGLSAIPHHVVSRLTTKLSSGISHWLISLLPLIIFERVLQSIRPSENPQWNSFREVAATLYPMQSYLTTTLHSFTTTSLLPAELQLLSIALIDLLLLSNSPQTKILSSVLWIGGLGIIVLCSPIIRWSVALARIPRWRLRRAGRIIQARQSFIKALNEGLRDRVSRKRAKEVVESDADDDMESPQIQAQTTGLDALKQEVLSRLRTFFPAENDETLSAVEKSSRDRLGKWDSSPARPGRRRRNTLPANPSNPSNPSNRAEEDRTTKRRRRRSKTVDASFFLSLTPSQAAFRNWIYAGYLYLIAAILILGPTRTVVARTALYGAEPFGWAIGYLFGDIRNVRFQVVSSNLGSWIPLPPLHTATKESAKVLLGRAAYYREVFGAANVRLGLCAFCAVTVISGIIAVLHLPSAVEVDTRRKVFHGTMVAMLLPTIFIDPNFSSLALAIVLAVFCLLDLLRASQLPPLSKPLANFLAPYVDGRDNRGPVVISHIFLLIGCAVPLWLSLAATRLSGTFPWQDWEADTRHLSMMAGVICVGMGDAAASLIGRRFGRHKWPWAGGKSLEGSVAFAAAVFIGLVCSKLWLWLGQWQDETLESRSFAVLTWKPAMAGVGASLMEAVLTGGNDNVVVPVYLWLLVRALRM